MIHYTEKAVTRSVPKSMQRIVTTPKGKGTSNKMNIRKGEISGMLLVSVYAMDFFRLSKINRPKIKNPPQVLSDCYQNVLVNELDM